MARITVEDCIDKFPSRFELVLVASQRARRLHSGDEPTVEKDNDKNTVIALREIADITISSEQMKENLIQEYQTVSINDEEEENKDQEFLENESYRSNDGNIKDLDNSLEKNTLDMLKEKEVESEMQDLISSEDKEIESQYEISENLNENNLNTDDNHEQDSQLSNEDKEIESQYEISENLNENNLNTDDNNEQDSQLSEKE